jgi:hypothetical protein
MPVAHATTHMEPRALPEDSQSEGISASDPVVSVTVEVAGKMMVARVVNILVEVEGRR